MDLFPTPDHADANSLLLDIRLAHLFLDTAETLKDPNLKQRFYVMVDRAIQTVTHVLRIAPASGLENVSIELNAQRRFRNASTENSSAASAG